MKLGVIVSPAAGYSYEEILAAARATEAGGFDSFWISDHFFGGEGFPDRDCLEAWTALAALARDTTSVRLGCLVTAAQYRNPALLAKIVASVDQLSGGRIEFGIGAGWKENEYVAYGYEFPDPGTRVTQMNETVEICRRLWTQERASFSGKHYRIAGAVCSPKPKQSPYPPLWIGGSGPRVMRSAARYADGFDIGKHGPGGAALSEDEVRAFNAQLDDACAAVKRERPLLRSHWTSVAVKDDASLRDFRERAAAYARAGLDRWIVAPPRESATEMIGRMRL